MDTHGRTGLALTARYDSLLAKVVTHVHGASFPAALRKSRTALAEFDVEGVRTNLNFLRELLSDVELQSGVVTTDFLDDKLPELAAAALSHVHDTAMPAVELHPGRKHCARSWPAPWSRSRRRAARPIPANSWCYSKR